MVAQQLKGQRLRAQVKLVRVLYPRQHEPGEFAIAVLEVLEVLEGEIPDEFRETTEHFSYGGVNKNIEITVKGNMPAMRPDLEYIFQGILDIDKRYGPGYNVEQLRLNYSMDTEEDQRKFFLAFLTEKQVEALMAPGNNPLKWLEDHDVEQLKTIKGIGDVVAERMISRYEESKDYGRAFVELDGLGLTNAAVEKLVKRYGSVDTMVDKIKQNPYILIKEVRGYGWEKADAIARRQGLTPDCKERVIAYAQYYLEKEASDNGNSWIMIDTLLQEIAAMCYPITKENLFTYVKSVMGADEAFKKFADMTKAERYKYQDEMPMLYYETSTRRVGMFWLRLMEYDISRHLERLRNAPKRYVFTEEQIQDAIHAAEKEQGFEYDSDQKAAIEQIIASNVSILTGLAGCVDKETEFLTPYGWKKICDYEEGDEVLQYNKNGTATFVKPERYIKEPCDTFYHFETKHGVDQTLSEDHILTYVSEEGKLRHEPFANYLSREKPFSGRFITAFKASGKGINMSIEELRLNVAIIAVGIIESDEAPHQVQFHLKKDCKKQRLKQLLDDLKIKYIRQESPVEGYTDFYMTYPNPVKTFPKDWYRCSQKQLQAIAEELPYWFGSLSKRRCGGAPVRVFSNVSENSDFIQYAFAATNRRATVRTFDRISQQYSADGEPCPKEVKETDVAIVDKILCGINNDKKDDHKMMAFNTVPSEDGFKYCFTMPSGMWIMRRNGKIAVTHNCGKTALLNAVSKLFRNAGMRLEQCALSGRASSKMSEVTKLTGKTIHRLLCYLPDEERFLYNADNWVPADVIILDETSMVGGELFLQLIEAIPTGARFIMVGDHHQLEAIGLANVFKDCLSSGGYIPSSVLTKIHRQATKSGIITESIRASNGERMLKDDFIGEETRGELQDFKIISSLDPALTQMNILQEYRRLLAAGIESNDIQVIVAQRTRGSISCRVLNEAIQEIVNPGVCPGDIKVPYVDNGIHYTVTYKRGDKVIVTKNNYHAKRPNQSKKRGDVQIFNGNVGYIEEINSEYMVVNLTEQGPVQIDRAGWNDISLAYAITCHKKQGDQVPYAIIGLDTSSYAMFSKEWVYTAITRASKHCTFVTTPLSINRAVKITRVKKKQTWLKAFLAQLRTAEVMDKEAE